MAAWAALTQALYTWDRHLEGDQKVMCYESYNYPGGRSEFGFKKEFFKGGRFKCYFKK